MAIKKSKTTKQGTVGEYWKITKEVYDQRSKKAEWVIALFVNKAASDALLAPLESKEFSAKLSQEEMASDRTAVGYNKIKEIAALIVPPLFGPLGESHRRDPDLYQGEDA
jgi:hypothetical protein